MADNFNSFFPLPTIKWTSPAGVVFLTFAEHHNIMQSLFLDQFGNVHPMFLELAQAGFDVRSFAANGTPLPSTQAAADIIGSAYHGGNHRALTDWVNGELRITERLVRVTGTVADFSYRIVNNRNFPDR